MSEFMTCMSFEQLLKWIQTEHDTKGTVFGVHRPYVARQENTRTLFGRKLETVIGPAAGPNSQMAQNLVAAYYAGSRFFELKTVQIMDGAELSACVNKPCIKADDEGYNCEWSTELTVPEAREEYIKAWFALSFLAKEYGLGEMDGFQFNLSVGYDLEGIQSPKIDGFIEEMKDAEKTEIWQECKAYLLAHVDEFSHMTREDIEAISPHICNSATLSTLHGCPPDEIERIATYLLTEKKMHTFIKCNPTLLGYDFARQTLDEMGYDYISFGRFHFEDDLQYTDAVPMLTRLMELSRSLGLEFGVKITNTFPVDVKAGELPSEEMYMSGKSLFPLSIALAAKLSKDFDGNLRISYSGGADAFNIVQIVDAGIWPVTMATTILKPGGYQRITQMAQSLEVLGAAPFTGVKVKDVEALAEGAKTDPHHTKPAKLPDVRKSEEKVPLLDCFEAPCEEACPIHQDVATYMMLSGEEKYEEAMDVILARNALPFITGTICSHPCMRHCTRNFYETPVQIRDTKLLCAQKAYVHAVDTLAVTGSSKKKVAVVGGGPAGMASAFYLARGGASVTLYEKRDRLGGVVSAIIPDFRIDDTVIDKDAEFLKKLGVDIRTGTEAPAVSELFKEGFDDVVLAVGASKRSTLTLEGKRAVNALDFLEEFNEKKGQVDLGNNVAVIGGGNTAMDTARAAIRTTGVKHVSLVYRRNKRYMPADEQELDLAVEDGVDFQDLLAPLRMEEGKLICHRTVLGERDASGRPGVVETEEEVAVLADTVIAAVGEKVPTDYYEESGLTTDDRGRVKANAAGMSSVPHVYVVGDGLYGPSIVVRAEAQAAAAAEDILGCPVVKDTAQKAKAEDIYRKKGILIEPGAEPEGERCLSCATICENCVDVCPNRANISIWVPGMEMAQVIHLDNLCNECGNCNSFCPYASAPYKDKFTLFASTDAMQESTNDGFAVQSIDPLSAHIRYLGRDYDWKKGEESVVPEGLLRLIEAVAADYAYLIP